MELDGTTTNNDPMEWTAADQAALEATATEPAGQAEETPEAPAEEGQPTDAIAAAIEDDDDGDDESPSAAQRPGFVPHRKLHKAIEARKKVEADLTKEREERIRLEERTNQLLQRFQQPQPEARPEPEPPPPNPEDDFFGALAHQSKTVEELKRDVDNYKKQQEQESRVKSVLNAAHSAEREFITEAPDYPDAMEHLRNSRVAELKVFGLNDTQARQRVGQEEIQMAAQALQRNVSPARLAYQWATQRGYVKKAPANEEAAPSEDAATRINRAADAQSRSQTLGGGGSSAPVGLTAQSVAKMSEAEFAKLMETNPSALNKLMGA